MEKKKLVRFSLEEWQANPKRKVVTNTGKDVRILCVDRMGGERIMPVIALVLCEGIGCRAEALCEFDANGVQNGEEDNNGWRLYFEETSEDNLVKELLENGFRYISKEEKDFYKTINAGSANEYDIYVNVTEKTASYLRKKNGTYASARMPFEEGTTSAEIEKWAEKLDATRL